MKLSPSNIPKFEDFLLLSNRVSGEETINTLANGEILRANHASNLKCSQRHAAPPKIVIK